MKIKSLFYVYIIVVGLFFSNSACVSAQEINHEKSLNETTETSKKEDLIKAKNVSEEENFAVKKTDFKLFENDGKCFVNYEKGGKSADLALEIPPPCKVVRDAKNNVRFVTYKDIKSDVFMIVGDVQKMGGKPCGTKAQVILLKKDSAAPGKVQKGTVCVLYGTDEKDFWMLSH